MTQCSFRTLNPKNVSLNNFLRQQYGTHTPMLLSFSLFCFFFLVFPIRFLESISRSLGVSAVSAVRSSALDCLPALVVLSRMRGSLEVLSLIPGERSANPFCSSRVPFFSSTKRQTLCFLVLSTYVRSFTFDYQYRFYFYPMLGYTCSMTWCLYVKLRQ